VPNRASIGNLLASLVAYTIFMGIFMGILLGAIGGDVGVLELLIWCAALAVGILLIVRRYQHARESTQYPNRS
jgi:hypothetical protein